MVSHENITSDLENVTSDHENIISDHENITSDHENITSDHENIFELFKFMVLQNENWIHSICLFLGLKTS